MHSPYVGVLSILISRLNILSEKFAEHWLRCGPRAQPVQAMRLAYMTDLTFIRSIESDVLGGVLKVFHDIYICTAMQHENKLEYIYYCKIINLSGLAKREWQSVNGKKKSFV